MQGELSRLAQWLTKELREDGLKAQRQAVQDAAQLVRAVALSVWREGEVELRDMATIRESATWGPSAQVRSVGDLRRLASGSGGSGAGGVGLRLLHERTAVDVLRERERRGPPRVLGISFFRAEASGAAGQISVSQARAIGEAADGWLRHERILREDYLPRFELEDEVEWTIGLWEGPEPSFNARVTGARERVIEMAKAWGRDFQQDAVAVLLPERGAEGGILEWDIGEPVDDVTLQTLLAAVNEVNLDLAERVAKELKLWDDFGVGLTVKESRYIEFWVGGDLDARGGYILINEALRRAGLKANHARHRDYVFQLLFAGKDY